jgi:hypothetical protein
MKIAIEFSKRMFKVVGFENLDYINENFSLGFLLSNNTDTDTEWLYTLQEDVDSIIDLKVGETYLTKSTRDGAKFNDVIVIRTI